MTLAADGGDLVRSGVLADDMARTIGAGRVSVGASAWAGPAARRYERAASMLDVVCRTLAADLAELSSHLIRLGAAVEGLAESEWRWQQTVIAAECRLAVAWESGDVLMADAAEREVADLRRAADRALSGEGDELRALDRQTAAMVDSVARVHVATDLAPSVPALLQAISGDGFDLELELMDAAARQAMVEHATGPLASRIEHLEEVVDYFKRWGLPGVRLALLDELKAHRRRLLDWVESDRVFLSYDPADGSRVVEVFGDLGSAEHIALVVPGITNSEYNYHQHLEPTARALQGGNADTAVIAWLGYDTPGSGPTGTGVLTFDAIDDDHALVGAAELAEFMAWLGIARDDAHISVIAHSYGSVVAAIAAAEEGLAVDDLVLVGSPGVPVDHVSDLALNADARVWAGLAPWDPIDELAWLAGLDGGLIHGVDPTSDGFGALELSFEDVVGHSGYFDAAGIAILAGVVAGRGRGAGQRHERRSGAW